MGLEDTVSWDGHVYYRNEDFGERRGTVVGYAGRDGLYAGLFDGQIIGDQTVSRLEIKVRPWQFYRDGFYRGDAFVPNGLYEGRDYDPEQFLSPQTVAQVTADAVNAPRDAHIHEVIVRPR